MGVSIITPAYNVGRYIVETVESVLAQGNREGFEYIILDDGSSDDTLAKLEPYRDRLTIVSHPNMGEQATVNKGIAMASHDIIAVVNADDPIYPGLLDKALNLLQENPNLVAVYPDWKKIDGSGKVIEEKRTYDFDYNIMLELYCCIPGPGTLFRKSALKGELPRNPAYRYSGDFDLWLRLGLHGPMARIPEYLATWRHHESGASQSCINPEMANNRIAVMKNFFARQGLPREICAKKKQALSAAYYHGGVLALHNDAIPGRKYLLLSFLYSFIWPRKNLTIEQRNWLYIVYIFGTPFTTLAYKIVCMLRNHRRKSYA
jgi:glycosyltransferase involved in cell wall biosynthesis